MLGANAPVRADLVVLEFPVLEQLHHEGAGHIEQIGGLLRRQQRMDGDEAQGQCPNLLSGPVCGVQVTPTYATRCTTWSGSTGCTTKGSAPLTLQKPWASFSARL